MRQATMDDLKWINPFYEHLMRPYVEMTHEWDPNKFSSSYDPEKTRIIQLNDKDIGIIVVEERDDCFFLRDIQIDSKFQGRGIGSHLVNEIKMEVLKKDRKPIKLRVLKGNPAKDLYLKLGFVVHEELDNCFELIYWAEQTL